MEASRSDAPSPWRRPRSLPVTRSSHLLEGINRVLVASDLLELFGEYIVADQAVEGCYVKR